MAVLAGAGCVPRATVERVLDPVGGGLGDTRRLEEMGPHAVPALLEIVRDYKTASVDMLKGNHSKDNVRKEGIREQAVFALGAILASEELCDLIVPPLRDAAADAADPAHGQAMMALGLCGTRCGVTALKGLMVDWCSRGGIRDGCYSAIGVLGSTPNPEAHAAVEEYAGDEKDEYMQQALKSARARRTKFEMPAKTDRPMARDGASCQTVGQMDDCAFLIVALIGLVGWGRLSLGRHAS